MSFGKIIYVFIYLFYQIKILKLITASPRLKHLYFAFGYFSVVESRNGGLCVACAVASCLLYIPAIADQSMSNVLLGGKIHLEQMTAYNVTDSHQPTGAVDKAALYVE